MVNNKSKTYLLPLLSELVGFKKEFHRNINDTYINFTEDIYENCIGIVQSFSFKNPDYTAYENKLIKNELFVELIDIEDNQVIYIFKFPKEYLDEFNYFKEGKYSQFGKDAKDLILEYYGHIYKNNINAVPFLMKAKQILFKDKKLKKQLEKELKVVIDDDAELSDIVSLIDETFDTEKYTKNKE